MTNAVFLLVSVLPTLVRFHDKKGGGPMVAGPRFFFRNMTFFPLFSICVLLLFVSSNGSFNVVLFVEWRQSGSLE